MNNINLASDYNDVVGAGDYRQSEWAGACYSPDGRWLFANIQTPGVTFAITGPWGNGPLLGRRYGRRGPSGENRTVACGSVCTVS
jgi:secreted PhoX family phosphatase